jgi:hypothetical protein
MNFMRKFSRRKNIWLARRPPRRDEGGALAVSTLRSTPNLKLPEIWTWILQVDAMNRFPGLVDDIECGSIQKPCFAGKAIVFTRLKYRSCPDFGTRRHHDSTLRSGKLPLPATGSFEAGPN